MDPMIRRGIVRDALAVAVATAAYGLSFGALAVAADFSVAQAAVLSALAFTGASQLVFVAILGDGGTALAAVSVALLLGARNGLYAVRLTPLMQWRGWRRVLGAHLTIDETTAMATARDDPAQTRLAFWATGILLWTLWNLSTVIGALAGNAVGSPETWGLDVAFPAAFVALLAPQLRTRRAIVTAVTAVLVALVLVPFAALGVALLAPALVVVPIAWWWRPEWEHRK
ncbi:MAG: AzlC family ABC transporter permease [Mycobacteriales bacterium]